DLEDVLEPILRSFALVALARHDAEQVPALAFGHRLGYSARNAARAVRAVPTRRRGGPARHCTARGQRRTRSGACAPALAHVVQLLEGDDAAVDGVTEGAGLGPGLGHTDQVRSEEVIDVLWRGVTDGLEQALRCFHFGLDDGEAAVLLRGNLEDRGPDPCES